ncbi:hypothetical protein DL89DRAFT_45159 [Linderina pennispora]|uniref:RING-type domain-containing protein n=1 Tax=Linderina pennispora TaxID=61395 RepID=A0A1Y1W1Z5_9FUNG|nr:uncharacterized protein DL89DRAFT_45159 [Linderina pennispora]ORX67472.1 hypothetical protein DL89DRAFT_45159 [Linderina pennispora]
MIMYERDICLLRNAVGLVLRSICDFELVEQLDAMHTRNGHFSHVYAACLIERHCRWIAYTHALGVDANWQLFILFKPERIFASYLYIDFSPFYFTYLYSIACKRFVAWFHTILQDVLFAWAFLAAAQARAPLVSLTVSVQSNVTSDTQRSAYQATFDRSDYAYPLPQTGLSTFGFAGELYVPESADCADDAILRTVRKYTKPDHPNGIAFLPYKSCRSEWEWVLHQETESGRAAGALLYSMKDDAAQAAERAVVDLTYLHTPVWVVNNVAGAYLIRVLEHVYGNASKVDLPQPPNNIKYEYLQDDVKMAVRIATEGSQLTHPRVFITIGRSAADVASADRNFFLKAMVGVGITGIVCFVIAMLVRYFDCLKLSRHRVRAGRRSTEFHPRATTMWARNSGQAFRARSRRARHADAHGHRRNSTRRVLQQSELDLMPLRIVTHRDLQPPDTLGLPGNMKKPQMAILRSNASCPHLPQMPGSSLELARVYSAQLGELPSKDPVLTSWDDDDDDLNECAICLDEIREGDVVRELPCPHTFHSRCIDRWLLFQSSVCPLCKRDTLIEPPAVEHVA